MPSEFIYDRAPHFVPYCTIAPPRFTGKERDTESGNDYFGARYYASTMGRFMSPDWTETPDPTPYADLKNPQSLNLYTYGSNNPLRSADPDGHRPVTHCAPDTGSTDKNGTYTVTAGKCTTMDDGSIDPSSDGLGLILGWGAGKLLGPVIGGGARLLGAAIDSIGEALGLSSDAITITEDGMEHVLARHTADGASVTGRKSVFTGSKNEIKSLIQKASSTKATVEPGGNLVRTVDAGRSVGIDRATGAPTSVYTVYTDKAGNLLSAHPGRP